MEPPLDVIIIGGGPSGVAFAKELHEHGLSLLLFDGADRIGGVFASHYPETKLTSSTALTAYSDYSRPEEDTFPRHWRADEYVVYLEEYAAHFGVSDRIRLRHRVTSVEWQDDREFFVVSVENENGDSISVKTNRIVVASGTHHHARLPQWPGQDTFAGKIEHTRDFSTGSDYAGKNVVIVGGGESTADITLAIAQHAAKSAVSIRSGWGHLVSRTATEEGREPSWDYDYPTDCMTRRIRYLVPPTVANARLQSRFERAIQTATENGLPILALMATINQGQASHEQNRFGCKSLLGLHAIAFHGCEQKPGIASLRGDTVVFADGTEMQADVIVCATGYAFSFDFLKGALQPATIAARQPRKHLYRHMFHPDWGDRIVWAGFARPAFGAIPPLSEMQARLYGQVIAGNVKLPARDEMGEQMRAYDNKIMEQFPHNAPSVATLTDFLYLLDEIAEEIGCMPPRLLFRDRDLWTSVMLGPISAAQYRLRGPGAKPTLARERLLRLPYIPTKSNPFLLTSGAICDLLERTLGPKAPALLRTNGRFVW